MKKITFLLLTAGIFLTSCTKENDTDAGMRIDGNGRAYTGTNNVPAIQPAPTHNDRGFGIDPNGREQGSGIDPNGKK